MQRKISIRQAPETFKINALSGQKRQRLIEPPSDSRRTLRRASAAAWASQASKFAIPVTIMASFGQHIFSKTGKDISKRDALLLPVD
ncbi:hypothetical protein [Paenibacillus chitinolyticus]